MRGLPRAHSRAQKPSGEGIKGVAPLIVGIPFSGEPASLRVVGPGRGSRPSVVGKVLPSLHGQHPSLGIVGVFHRIRARAVGFLEQPVQMELVGDAGSVRKDNLPGVPSGIKRSAVRLGGLPRRRAPG